MYGPYTIGFPNIVQESLDAKLRLLGFGARNPLERTLFRHPDGRSWEILESLATAPEFVAAVGIARGAGNAPISPVNAQGYGGPAYSMCVVEDTDRMAGFMRDALGFEIRNRRRQTSAGRQGAMNTPDGTQFEIAQAYPPYGEYGFLILLQFINLPVAEPPRLRARAKYAGRYYWRIRATAWRSTPVFWRPAACASSCSSPLGSFPSFFII